MNPPECPKCGRKMHQGGVAGSGRLRWHCRPGRKYCYSTTSPASEKRERDGSTGKNTRFKRALSDSKVFIITTAQNSTPVHPGFWACLQTAVKDRDAELLVIPIRYKNPTSRWTASQANEEVWAMECTPYLWNVRKVLNSNLVLLADSKIQPTAGDPISGYDPLSGGSSAILGHTKAALRSIATPSNRMAKIVVTTGACTVPNFTDSKAGKLGEFHHTLSALVVEMQGSKFHLRRICYDKTTNSVIDLDTQYFESKVEKAPRPLALVMGDSHVDFIDPAVERATFGPGGIVETLRPRHLVWHDLLDGYSCNPHHAGNPFNKIAKLKSGHDDVQAEVERACHFVRERTTGDMQSVIVPSNHDDFLRRWIVTHDWKSDPVNAEFYLSTALSMVRGTSFTGAGTEYPSPFPMVFPTVVDMNGIILLGSEPFVLGGVELSQHGDRGPNGSRGSIKNLRRIGVRSIIGHSHSPGEDEGCTQTGTSTRLRLEYNGGPSSWLNAHCILHANGKRQLVFIIDSKWRA